MAKTRWGLILLGLVLVGVALAVFETQRGGSLSVLDTGGIFNKPAFASVYCTVTNLNELKSISVPTAGVSIPFNGYSKTNEVIIHSIDGNTENSGSYWFDYGICREATCSMTQSQSVIAPGADYKFKTLQNGETITIQIRKGGLLHVLSYATTAQINIKLDRYGLQWRHGDGRLEVINTGCTLQDLSNNQLPKTCAGTACVGSGYPAVLSFDSYLNYVDGWNIATTTGNLYQYKGQDVYILGKGQYAPVVEVEMYGGQKIKTVDFQNPVFDSAIQCSPSEPNCGADFKIIPVLTDKNNCGTFVGCAQGRLDDTSGKYANEWVEYGCVSGSCQIVNHGAKSCDYNKPCAAGYACGADFVCREASGNGPRQEKEQTPFDKLLVASGLFGLVAALLVFLNSKKRNAERALVAGLSLAVGAIVALTVYYVGAYLLALPSWAVWLGVAGAGVGLYLVGGALFTILLALVLRR